MGETGTGAEPAPSIPSEPWGASGHLLLRRRRRLIHRDPALKANTINNTSLHFTRVIDRRASHLRTCSQWKKRSIVVIHTFLRAVCVCAVGLRLPELKERLQKEHSGCNRRAEWEKYKLTAYCYQHSFTYRCCEAAT